MTATELIGEIVCLLERDGWAVITYNDKIAWGLIVDGTFKEERFVTFETVRVATKRGIEAAILSAVRAMTYLDNISGSEFSVHAD